MNWRDDDREISNLISVPFFLHPSSYLATGVHFDNLDLRVSGGERNRGGGFVVPVGLREAELNDHEEQREGERR